MLRGLGHYGLPETLALTHATSTLFNITIYLSKIQAPFKMTDYIPPFISTLKVIWLSKIETCFL